MTHEGLVGEKQTAAKTPTEAGLGEFASKLVREFAHGASTPEARAVREEVRTKELTALLARYARLEELCAQGVR